MKVVKTSYVLFLASFFAATFLFNLSSMAQTKAKPWPVPDKDKALKATVKLSDAGVISSGKDLWAKHCKSCHGAKGLGDGPKAATLKTNPGDFSTAQFAANTDGELFYRMNKGREDMPGYEKKIPDVSERWALVAFMRTLKK